MTLRFNVCFDLWKSLLETNIFLQKLTRNIGVET